MLRSTGFTKLARAAAAALAVGGAALATSAAAAGCSGDKGPGVKGPCPNGTQCQTRLTLLHTADIHSRLLPYDLLITQVDGNLGLGPTGEVANVGGAARMAYVVNRERARAERSLHVSGGDCFQGAPIFNFFNGEPEMKAQAAIGVDAMSVANHEFDKGPIVLAQQIQQWASFPVLAANYRFEDPLQPSTTPVGINMKPFATFNVGGLKVGVVGMANLSSLTSIFDQPNRLGITPLNTVEVAQFYIDLLRPMVDVVVFTTHLGLDVDQRMIRQTTGIDVVLGSHNHIVLNPPQEIFDCSADPQNPGYIWVLDPKLPYDNNVPPPNDELHPDPVNHPFQMKRTCVPRRVTLAHSGAFAKYVGRLDLVLSNIPAEASPNGDPSAYQPINGFEVISSKYVAFPINASVPEEPRVAEMLLPYQQRLDLVADLNLLVGYAPNQVRRFASQGGDSPLGNLVGDAIWLRLGVQTDFSLTNSTGIRQDLLPGPITVEQMYNIFPFDNSISKMQLSGVEVQEMFDFVARRSASRGCTSQVQIAGARVRLNCTGCTRPGARPPCVTDDDCPIKDPGSCDVAAGLCNVTACADHVYIGFTQDTKKTCPKDDPYCNLTVCNSDQDCLDGEGKPRPGACAKPSPERTGYCMAPIVPTNLYELATSNYLAGGGSGFRVLQRNTTQFDTKIQQRDALIDYIRAGKPCGWKKDAGTKEGLKACGTDADCSSEGDFVCACPGASVHEVVNGTLTCKPAAECSPDVGRCVRRDCRDQVAQFRDRRCATSKSESCRADLDPCTIGGESCKLLACVDDARGAKTDNRVQMLGR
jgi:5'-nucleotidase